MDKAYILTISYGSETGTENSTSFGIFPHPQNALDYFEQDPSNVIPENAIARIYPFNFVEIEEDNSNKIEFSSDPAAKVVSINKNNNQIIFTPEDEPKH